MPFSPYPKREPVFRCARFITFGLHRITHILFSDELKHCLSTDPHKLSPRKHTGHVVNHIRYIDHYNGKVIVGEVTSYWINVLPYIHSVKEPKRIVGIQIVAEL